MIPRDARYMGGGEISVRMGTGVLTSDHKALCGKVSDVTFSEWRVARLAKRRGGGGFTRLRLLSTSRRTDLGQRCWGSVPFFRAAGFCGNMVMAATIASPKMVWRSEVIERMATSTPWRLKGVSFCP